MGKQCTWAEFYPNKCDDESVEKMIAEGTTIVCGAGVGEGELIEAFANLEEDDNKRKILNDLISDGYRLKEEDVMNYFLAESDCDLLNEMIDMHEGYFRTDTIVEFYTTGTEMKLRNLLRKVSPADEFTAEQVTDILDYISMKDTEGVKALLDRFNPPSLDKDTLTGMLDSIPSAAMDSARKYLALLSPEERAEVEEEYYM